MVALRRCDADADLASSNVSPPSRATRRSVVSAERASRLLRDHDDDSLGPGRHQEAVDDLAVAAPDLADTVVQQAGQLEEQAKRFRTAYAIAQARRSVVAEYVHGEECEAGYGGRCDCGHEDLLRTFADLARVLGTGT